MYTILLCDLICELNFTCTHACTIIYTHMLDLIYRTTFHHACTHARNSRTLHGSTSCEHTIMQPWRTDGSSLCCACSRIHLASVIMHAHTGYLLQGIVSLLASAWSSEHARVTRRPEERKYVIFSTTHIIRYHRHDYQY